MNYKLNDEKKKKGYYQKNQFVFYMKCVTRYPYILFTEDYNLLLRVKIKQEITKYNVVARMFCVKA